MKVSTKGRYGLRALVDLTYNSSDSTVSLVSVAQRQNISLNYLEQVFASLRKAGIVKSVKGSQGGYMLADKPENLKVGDILAVLEGKFSIVDEVDDEESLDNVQRAINTLVWNKINKNINEFLYSNTLADLVSEYERLNTETGGMYYI